MKNIALTLSLIFCSLIGNAQKTKEFLNRSYSPTDEQHAVYYRMKPPAGFAKAQEVDTAKIFYISNDKVSRATVSNFDAKESFTQEWFENGVKAKEVSHKDYLLTGTGKIWYRSGKLKMTIIAAKDDDMIDITDDRQATIEDYWDEEGNQLVKDGSGVCKCRSNAVSINTLDEHGTLVKGRRDGDWQSFRGDSLILNEKFKNGELVNGVRYTRGVKSTYTVFNEMPTFKGGIEAMSRYIQRTLKYPSTARRRGDQGKVFVQFVVNQDGSISDVETIKGVTGIINEEAARVVRAMPNWVPGTHRGKSVRVKYVVPINFRLAR